MSENDPEARAALISKVGAANIDTVLRAFEELRFSRLCMYLRQREPDDHVGYSILIYRLTDEDLAEALEGDPPLPPTANVGTPRTMPRSSLR